MEEREVLIMTESLNKSGDGVFDPSALPLEELRNRCVSELGLTKYRADQIFAWIHRRGVTDFSKMTDLSKDLRKELPQKARINTLKTEKIRKTPDGVTKATVRTVDRHLVETVIIPEGDKVTQCISTQVGCRMGCRFCATAQMGFARNLTAGEIVGQVSLGRQLTEKSGQRISNLVYMGMGEPLDNYESVRDSLLILLDSRGQDFSTRKITVSTAGHVPGLQKLAEESFQVNLAVSINSPKQEVRARIMPIARRWSLSELIQALRFFPLQKRRRITVEYVLLSGINDSLEDARNLARLFRGIPSKINLIRINPFSGCPYIPPSMEETEKFQETLRNAGYTVFLRKSRGAEIQGGCGQLAADGMYEC